jgi:ABC-type transport system substrate-binding protein
MEDPVVGGASPRNRKLRQAISLALDVDELIDLYYQGNAQPAQSLIPPGLFGYDPDYQNPYRAHDLARAKRLLAEAGYPGGISAAPASG